MKKGIKAQNEKKIAREYIPKSILGLRNEPMQKRAIAAALANLKSVFIFVLFLLALAAFVIADAWTASQPSHQTLYTDTITSKTDASWVTVADSQGFEATGNTYLATAGGNVGIGTMGPDDRLHVDGDIRIANIGLTTDYAQMKIRDNDLIFDTYDADVKFYVGPLSATNAITIDGTNNIGRVGIGTESPNRILELAQPSYGTGVRMSYTGFPTYADIYTANDGLHFYNTLGSQADFVFGGRIDPNDVEWLRIKGDSGNVGIGTTNPGSKLDVRGGIRTSYADGSNSGVEFWTAYAPLQTSCITACGNGYCVGGYRRDNNNRIGNSMVSNNCGNQNLPDKDCMCMGRP